MGSQESKNGSHSIDCFQHCRNCKNCVSKYEVTLTSENGTKVFAYVCKETYRKLAE